MSLRLPAQLKATPNWVPGILGLTGEEWCLQLTRGFVVLVDASAICWLSKHSWLLDRDSAGNLRAVRKLGPRGKQKTIAMRSELARHALAQFGIYPDRVQTRPLSGHNWLPYRILDNRQQALQFRPRGLPGISCIVVRTSGRATIRWRAHLDYGGQRVVPGYHRSEFEARQAQRRFILSHYTTAAPRLLRKYGLQSLRPPAFPDVIRSGVLPLDTSVSDRLGFAPIGRELENEFLRLLA